MKRSQAGLEFLMTYGWAIMVVVVGIGALVYFNVLDVSRFAPETCVGEKPVSCLGKPHFEKDTVSFALVNGLPAAMAIEAYDAVLPEGCTNLYFCGPRDTSCTNTSKTVLAGQDFVVVMKCNEDSKLKGEITIPYTDTMTGLAREMTVSVIARNTAPSIPQGGSGNTTPLYSMSINSLSFDKQSGLMTLNVKNSGTRDVDFKAQISMLNIFTRKQDKYPDPALTETIAPGQNKDVIIIARLDDYDFEYNYHHVRTLIEYGKKGGLLNQSIDKQIPLDPSSYERDWKVIDATYDPKSQKFLLTIDNIGPYELMIKGSMFYETPPTGVVEISISPEAIIQGQHFISLTDKSDPGHLTSYLEKVDVYLEYGRVGAGYVSSYLQNKIPVYTGAKPFVLEAQKEAGYSRESDFFTLDYKSTSKSDLEYYGEIIIKTKEEDFIVPIEKGIIAPGESSVKVGNKVIDPKFLTDPPVKKIDLYTYYREKGAELPYSLNTQKNFPLKVY